MVLSISTANLQAQQSALSSNVYTPLVSGTAADFTNTSSQTGLGVNHFDPVGDLSDLTDPSLADAVTWTSLVTVGTVQRWVQVQDERASALGNRYTAGNYAGFVFTSASLLSALSTTTVTIQTYLGNTPVGLSSGPISLSSLVKVAGVDQSKVGYISTADFDGIRITFDISGLASVIPSISVNYAEVAKFVAGPALVCNTNTAMNLPTYPMSVSSSIAGPITLLGGISNLDAVISNSTSDFATINPSIGLLGDSITIGVKDILTDHAHPTFVGFDIESVSLANLSVAGNIVIKTYNNGVLTGRATGSSILAGASVLTGSNRQLIGFVPNGPVDSACLTLKSGAIAGVTLGITNVYNAVFRRFCEGSALACNTLSLMAGTQYPVYINAERTGITGGVLGVNNKIEDASKVIDNDPNSFATATVLVGALNQVSLSVRKEGVDFSDSTFAGFEIANTSTLLTAALLSDITIRTYKDGNPVPIQTVTAGSGLLSVASSLLGGGSNRQVVGLFATADYDEVVISFNNTVAANTGITRIYGFYSQNFCSGTINCNGAYWLNSGPPPTGYPVIINAQRTGLSGVACANLTGYELNNSQNVISTSATDFASVKMGVNALCPVSISVEDILTTYPSGTIAGFAIRNMSSLVELDLFNSITLQTWKDGVLQQSATGVGLLKLELLNSPIFGGGAGTYNVGFKATLPFDEVRISFGGLLNVDPLNEVRVYGAYVDTRFVTSSDGTQALTCLVPSVTPATPAPICSGSSVLLTAAPAGATGYQWYKDSVVIGGAINQTYSATTSGSYTVTVNMIGYSGAFSNAVVVTVNTCVSSVTADTENEGDALVHTVTLGGATATSTNFAFSVADVTTTAGTDYSTTYTFSNGVINNGDGTITVPAGVTSFTITVQSTEDANFEANETYTMTVGGQSGTGTISNDDGITVSGHIYIDADGTTDGLIDGTGTNAAGNLYISVVASGNTIVATAPVAADGSYSLNVPAAGTYTLTLHTSPGGSTVRSLPTTNYENTAEGFGNTSDGTANGYLSVTVVATNISNANFGFDQLPETDDANEIVPGTIVLGQKYVLDNTPMSGSDPEDGPTPGSLSTGSTFLITSLPSNAQLYYNDVLITPADVASGTGTARITNYDPTKLAIAFTVTPIPGTVASFSYALVDAAGKVDASSATYSATVSALLPVSNVVLSVQRSAGDVQVNWITLTEQGTDYFRIEKSSDGRSYRSIGGKVAAAGNSNQQMKYSIVDKDEITPMLLYRVRVYYKDGKSAVSNIAVIRMSINRDHVQVFPNPVVDRFFVSFAAAGKYRLQLIDGRGMVVMMKDIEVSPGNLNISLERGVLAAGSYHLGIQRRETGERESIKMIFTQR